MLGSLSEADDAVQETWLRYERANPTDVTNLRGWLTTVIARICLDALRSRTSRREDPLDARAEQAAPADAEQELMLADSVGLALLVVLDRLDPAERLAFVLHDLFAVPFDDIAEIIGRSPDATRQLASRARRRVQGARAPDVDLQRQRELVEAFLTALRAGDIEGVIAVLDPDIVVTAPDAAGKVRELRGARTWAAGAQAFGQLLQHVRPALVDGAVALLFAPKGRVVRVLRFTFGDGKIARAEVIVDRDELATLEIASLDPVGT